MIKDCKAHRSSRLGRTWVDLDHAEEQVNREKTRSLPRLARPGRTVPIFASGKSCKRQRDFVQRAPGRSDYWRKPRSSEFAPKRSRSAVMTSK